MNLHIRTELYNQDVHKICNGCEYMEVKGVCVIKYLPDWIHLPCFHRDVLDMWGTFAIIKGSW